VRPRNTIVGTFNINNYITAGVVEHANLFSRTRFVKKPTDRILVTHASEWLIIRSGQCLAYLMMIIINIYNNNSKVLGTCLDQNSPCLVFIVVVGLKIFPCCCSPILYRYLYYTDAVAAELVSFTGCSVVKIIYLHTFFQKIKFPCGYVDSANWTINYFTRFSEK